jgi:TonB family protein
MSPGAPGAADGAGGRRAGMGLGRPAVVLSIVFHVTGFFLIVGVPRLLASGPDAGKVYVVDLVTLPGPAGPGPAAEAPPAAAPIAKPAPPKEAPKPVTPPKPPPVKKPAEKAIPIPDRNAKKPPKKPPEEKPKETPKPVETAQASATQEAAAATPAANEAAKPAAAAASGTPATTGTAPAPGTGAGGDGQGSGGGGDAYTFYLALLKRNIEQAWKRPVYNGDATLTATVNLRISSAGRVQRLELKTPSGFEPLDRSLLTAVRAAEPFPPFPSALAMDSLQVQIVFDLTPEDAAPKPGE